MRKYFIDDDKKEILALDDDKIIKFSPLVFTAEEVKAGFHSVTPMQIAKAKPKIKKTIVVKAPEATSPVMSELEAVRRIKTLWAEGDKSGIQTAQEIGISLGTMNRLIIKHGIVKK